MYSIRKVVPRISLVLFLVLTCHIYAATNNNEFKVIADIQALEVNSSTVVKQNNSAEAAVNIVRYVASNLDKLIDDKFGVAKKQLISNLPKINDLVSNSNKIKVQMLGPDLELLSIQTYTAGYQSIGLFLVYDLKNIKLSVIPFEQGSRYEFENTLNFKKIGDNLIQVTTKSRAAGDCGSVSNYKYTDGFFKLLKRRDFKCSN